MTTHMPVTAGRMPQRHPMAVLLALAILAVLLSASCGRKGHDLAYYERMIDSIRQAEQVKEIQEKAGLTDGNPVNEWFGKLQLRTLPIRNVGDDLPQIGSFVKVPPGITENFGYTEDAYLQAVMLPRAHRHDVVMLAEMKDSVSACLYLYTMDKQHMPLDELCIYDRNKEETNDDFGERFTEYFITSNYEVTLMHYYQSHDKDRKAELRQTVRYVINKEGMFEEVPIIY